MSQRPSVTRNAPPSPHRITLPPVQLRDGIEARHEGEILPRDIDRRAPLPSPQLSQTGGRTTPSGDGWRSAPPREHGVHSILNPPEPEVRSASERQPSGFPVESPSTGHSRPPSTFEPSPASTASTAHYSTQQPHMDSLPISESTGGNLSMARKILTPRSPLRTFSGTRSVGGQFIDATRSPFLSGRSRNYLPDQRVDSPAISTPPSATSSHPQTHYGFPPTATSSMSGRRASEESMHGRSQMPPSQSASPNIPMTSQNPISAQASPAGFSYQRVTQPPVSGSYYPGSSFAHMQHPGGRQEERATPEGPYSSQAPSQSSIPSVSAQRHTPSSDSIQIFTISTAGGPINVPVDVHQASKSADEKRKRNAGASARFRQRRKDKEKEATTNIDKLNQQARDLERHLREVEGERDFYKSERDRLRDVVYQTPEIRHHAQGRPSPRLIQSTTFRGQDSVSIGSSSSALGFSPEPADLEERAPRRRRFDGRFDPQGNPVHLPYSQHALTTLPAVQPPSSLPRPSGLPTLPPLRIESSGPGQHSGTQSAPPIETAPPPVQLPPFSQSSFERKWQPADGRMQL